MAKFLMIGSKKKMIKVTLWKEYLRFSYEMKIIFVIK